MSSDKPKLHSGLTLDDIERAKEKIRRLAEIECKTFDCPCPFCGGAFCTIDDHAEEIKKRREAREADEKAK